MNKNECKSKCKINKIGVTEDTLNGRDGMALHQTKRFFKSPSWLCGGIFRKIPRKSYSEA